MPCMLANQAQPGYGRLKISIYENYNGSRSAILYFSKLPYVEPVSGGGVGAF
jgi:hypothetical protein